MANEKTVTVPLSLWLQITSAMKRIQIPAPAGEVQAFLNRLDDHTPKEDAEQEPAPE